MAEGMDDAGGGMGMREDPQGLFSPRPLTQDASAVIGHEGRGGIAIGEGAIHLRKNCEKNCEKSQNIAKNCEPHYPPPPLQW